jgi:hypothetical protein
MKLGIDIDAIPEDDPARPLLCAIDGVLLQLHEILSADPWGDIPEPVQIQVANFIANSLAITLTANMLQPTLLHAAIAGLADGSNAVLNAHQQLDRKNGIVGGLLTVRPGEESNLETLSEKKH